MVFQHYIISGPPSSGKSALLTALSKNNFLCFTEVAREVIKENLSNNLDCFPWNNTLDFSDQVYRKSLKLLRSISSDFCFFDRSIIDIIAYMDMAKLPRNQEYLKTIRNLSYNKNVFFLPFWKDIYQNDNERKETMQEAAEIEAHLRSVYLEFGYNLIDIPCRTVSERVDFILNQL